MDDKDQKFDGKEDRNYHQKPFDESTDPLPQMDQASADASATTARKKTGAESEDSQSDKGRDARR